MYVKRLLAINLAVMATTTALLLGMGQNNLLLPLAAMMAVIASVWLTDIKGWFTLSHKIGNVAVLGAVFVTIGLMFQNTGQDLAVAIANLLVFVQITLLFQEKDLRNYWHIIILSAMQAVVAAAFSQGALFGLVLVVYVFVSISTLVLLFLHLERTHYRHNNGVAKTSKLRLGLSMSRGDWRRLSKIALATLVMGPLSLVLRYGDDAKSAKSKSRKDQSQPEPGRWPLSGMEPEFEGALVRSGGRAGVGPELFGRVIWITAASVVLSGIIFMTFPRVGDFEIGGLFFQRNPNVRQVNTSGFSNEMTLGELGDVLLDPDVVFQMRLADPETGSEYPVVSDLYVRGNILVNYSNRSNGRWSGPRESQVDGLPRNRDRRFGDESGQPPPPDSSFDGLSAKLDPSEPKSMEMVQQIINQERSNTRALFCVWPWERAFDNLPRSGGYTMRQEPGQLTRNGRPTSPYRLGTMAFVGGVQQELIPGQDHIIGQQLTSLPREAMPTLVSTANRWIEESGIPADDPIERAKYLNSRFRDPAEFTYTLDFQRRDAALDPIEDFMRNGRTGHCEYFATAMALMLRSQGIPSRVVLGFAVGEHLEDDKLDEDGNVVDTDAYHQFRNYDAHSWVEAYIAPEHIPAASVAVYGESAWSEGGWLRLDPTPPSDGGDSLATGMINLIEWATHFWQEYVVGMNYDVQREAIYQPIAAAAKDLAGNMGSVAWWRDLPRRMKQMLESIRDGLLGGKWISWRGGLAGALICLVLYGLYRLMRRAIRGLIAVVRRFRRKRLDLRQAEIEFYRNLEAIMAKYGMKRPAEKTQREFALAAAPRIAQRSGDTQLADLPEQVVEAFYQVRFGGEALDKTQTEAVEQALQRLRHGVSADGLPKGE